MEQRLLGIYLNDHLAGSTVGRALAKRTHASNASSEFGPFLAQLAREIEEDRDTLLEIMRALDVRPDRAKQALALVAERAGRLKPNGRLRSYSPLSRLVELEGLTLGVRGKLAAWRTLDAASADDARLRGFDLEGLIERANCQVDGLEEHRTKAAALL